MAGFKELIDRLNRAKKDGNENAEKRVLRELEELSAANPHQASARVTIANITEESYCLHRTYGVYVIAGKQPGQPYATTVVAGRKDVYDFGDSRKIDLMVSADDIAEDLCREINSDAGSANSSFTGVFVCAGTKPTESELDEAKERLTQFYLDKVNEADKAHEIGQGHITISTVHHRAARFLGLEKEWNVRAEAQPNCPVCQERIRAGAAMCIHCRTILLPEKMKKYMPEPAALTAGTKS